MSIQFKRLAAVVLPVFLAFLPSLFAELSTVDDAANYRWIATADTTLKDLFFPQASGGGYYRPLIGVSYLFDKYVWALDTRLMHLDNLLFHLVNSLLIYHLASLLLPREKRTSSLLPVAAALLFGLHPITVESVAWISGRTDIMAGTSVLLSTVFVFRFRENGKGRYLLYALTALVPGLLIKETPLAFVLGAVFILSARKEISAGPSDESVTRSAKGGIVRCVIFSIIAATALLVTYDVVAVLLVVLCYLSYEVYRDRCDGKSFQIVPMLAIAAGLVLPVGIILVVRNLVFTSNISSVGRTLKLIAGDINYACQTFFGAAGFYLRKFFVPFPLNFAIREIDPLYNAAGVILFFFCLYAIRRRDVTSALFLAGICLFLPALPLSLGTITWTGYAERYIYMSTAFWSLSVSRSVSNYAAASGRLRIAGLVTAVLLAIIWVCTFQRNVVWKTNLSLLADTVSKSPAFKVIRVDYMIALMARGDLEKAKEQYRIAQTIPSVGYMESLDINMAALHVQEGNYAAAEALYETALKKTRGKSSISYGAYLGYLRTRYADAKKINDGSDRIIGEKLLEVMTALYNLNKDSLLLYNAGQIALALGKCDEAEKIFLEAGRALPPDDTYGRTSRRIAAALNQNRCITIGR